MRSRATVQRAQIVIRSELTDSLLRRLSDPLLDQLSNHADENRVCADSFASNHVQAEFFAGVDGFAVQIEQHLHVVRQKPDGDNDDVFGPGFLQSREVIADIRLQPGILRPATSALVDEPPIILRDTDSFGNKSAAFGELLDVVASVGHRIRNAVRRKRELRFTSTLFRNLVETLLYEFGVRRDKVRVVIKNADLVDFRCPFTDGFLSVSDVLSILPAA